MFERLLPALALIGSAAAANAEPAHAWKTYVNDRFAYRLCYPADLMRPGSEPDMHDGVVFKGPQGSTLTVSGDLDGADAEVAKTAALESSGAKISYRARGKGWAVASGASPKGLVYVRAQASGDQEANYVLIYPAALKALYAPIIAKLNGCFRFDHLSN